MKKILVLVLVLGAVGIYFFLFNSERAPISLTEDGLNQPRFESNQIKNKLSALEVEKSKEPAEEPKNVDQNRLISETASFVEPIAENMLDKIYQGSSEDDIAGEYDPSAIAPEDESVQNVYDDAMQVSESDGLAPEAGSEMMPSGEGNPIRAESTDGKDGPESMGKPRV